jgi:hypothetical protein
LSPKVILFNNNKQNLLRKNNKNHTFSINPEQSEISNQALDPIPPPQKQINPTAKCVKTLVIFTINYPKLSNYPQRAVN